MGSALSTAGGSFGIFDGNVLAVSLRAVQSNSRSKVISAPRILTQSGQTGYISVGKNVPFITGKVTGESAGVNNPFQTIERHDVGVSLKVTPVVMGNGQLVLTIDTRADSISNDDQASDIITNQRQIQTTVQIKDGQTLLLGGLIDSSSSNADRSVPFISKIPVKDGNDVIKIWTGKFIPGRLSQIWQAEPEKNVSLPYQFTLMARQGGAEKDD